MFLRILKLDLKKKKGMNILLLLFIILASIFSASGLNNVVTVINGTDYYFDKAGVGDYVVIANTGCKLKEEVLPHIFDSFYRGSNSKKQEGSGLGLFICK